MGPVRHKWMGVPPSPVELPPTLKLRRDKSAFARGFGGTSWQDKSARQVLGALQTFFGKGSARRGLQVAFEIEGLLAESKLGAFPFSQ